MSPACQAQAFSEADTAEWEALCRASHAASFLHERGFLAYHGERLKDESLCLRLGTRLVGVLPAARSPQDARCVESHPGATYGGLVHAGALRGMASLQALHAAARYWQQAGYAGLRYTPMPHVYARAPAQDDLYALHRLGARRAACKLSAAIELTHPLARSGRRRRSLAKAQRAGLQCVQGAQWLPALWAVLQANLASRHQAEPVHSLAEAAALQQRFNRSIQVHAVLRGQELVAGVLVFEVGPCWHLQYIAASALGFELQALDLLVVQLQALATQAGMRWLDFGTSNEQGGRVLNEGLYQFKVEFGAGGVACETLELDLTALACSV